VSARAAAALATLAWAGTALAAPPPAPVDKGFAIMGATLLTAGPAGTIEKGTLLIRGGKIAAVGKDVQVAAGVPVIDATGRYITPGIVDAHSHTALEGSVNDRQIRREDVRARARGGR